MGRPRKDTEWVTPTPLAEWEDEAPQVNTLVWLHRVTGIDLKTLSRYSSGARRPESQEAREVIEVATGIPTDAWFRRRS